MSQTSARVQVCRSTSMPQNGGSRSMLFEEMLADSPALTSEQVYVLERFLSIDAKGRNPALIARARRPFGCEGYSGVVIEKPSTTCRYYLSQRRSNRSIGMSVLYPCDGKCTSESPIVQPRIPSPLVVSPSGTLFAKRAAAFSVDFQWLLGKCRISASICMSNAKTEEIESACENLPVELRNLGGVREARRYPWRIASKLSELFNRDPLDFLCGILVQIGSAHEQCQDG